jgi:hypothetical protein
VNGAGRAVSGSAVDGVGEGEEAEEEEDDEQQGLLRGEEGDAEQQARQAEAERYVLTHQATTMRK